MKRMVDLIGDEIEIQVIWTARRRYRWINDQPIDLDHHPINKVNIEDKYL